MTTVGKTELSPIGGIGRRSKAWACNLALAYTAEMSCAACIVRIANAPPAVPGNVARQRAEVDGPATGRENHSVNRNRWRGTNDRGATFSHRGRSREADRAARAVSSGVNACLPRSDRSDRSTIERLSPGDGRSGHGAVSYTQAPNH